VEGCLSGLTILYNVPLRGTPKKGNPYTIDSQFVTIQVVQFTVSRFAIFFIPTPVGATFFTPCDPTLPDGSMMDHLGEEAAGRDVEKG